MAVRADAIHGLALCAGAGGLELALHIAEPGYRTVGYVEREAYAAAALVARMDDAALDRAPVWDDLATFRGRDWRGSVDLVTAGYPCQPFSAAGRRLGTADPRHLWPHVRRVLVQVRPGWAFLENVAGHLSLGFELVHRELSQLGGEVAVRLQTAAEAGLPHERERLFALVHFPRWDTLADAVDRPRQGRGPSQSGDGTEPADRGRFVADSFRARLEGRAGQRVGSNARPLNEVAKTWRPEGISLSQAKRSSTLSRSGHPDLPMPVAGPRSLHAPGRSARLSLNPLFVEWLMGWPPGWTDCGLPVTGFARWLQRQRTELARLSWNYAPAPDAEPPMQQLELM